MSTKEPGPIQIHHVCGRVIKMYPDTSKFPLPLPNRDCGPAEGSGCGTSGARHELLGSSKIWCSCDNACCMSGQTIHRDLAVPIALVCDVGLASFLPHGFPLWVHERYWGLLKTYVITIGITICTPDLGQVEFSEKTVDEVQSMPRRMVPT